MEEARRIGYENLFFPSSFLAGGICMSLFLVYFEVVRKKVQKGRTVATK